MINNNDKVNMDVRQCDFHTAIINVDNNNGRQAVENAPLYSKQTVIR
jgi:hypothetical protein